MRKISKKGLTVESFTVGAIILLVGFVILLFVFTRISWESRIDKEVCHESVVLRGTLSSASELLESYSPLRCQTNKICVGTDCDEFGSAKGITKVKVKNEEEASKVLSDEIVDCWSMMGEGKVSLFTQYFAKNYGVGGVYPTCVICSRVAFDENYLSEKKINLKDVKIESYLRSHFTSDGKQSIYDYLSGGNAELSVENIQIKNINVVEKEGEKKYKVTNENEDLGEIADVEFLPEEDSSEIAVLFTQISSPSHSEVSSNTLKAIGGVYLGSSWIFGVKKTFKTTSSLIISHPVFTFSALAFGIGTQQLNVARNKAITSGYCGDVKTGGEQRDGCSVVKTVRYNAIEIAKYCSVIESIP